LAQEKSMPLTILFALEGAVVFLGVIVLAWWLRWRLNARWGTWFWGAISFGGSQLVRLPLLVLLTVLLPQIGFQPSRETAFWINLVVLSLTAGLFEETARYLVLRFLDKGARRWRDAIMFGAGHGGIEAVLVIVPTMINNIVLLSGGDALVEQTRSIAPQQAEQLAAALANLRAVEWWLPPLAVWERVAAIAFHIAASILVMQAVRRVTPGAAAWWGLAVLFHAAFNALALLIVQYAGLAASEIISTVVFFLALYLIFRFRRKEQDETDSLPSPTPVDA
jgi:uncharacterized membrane protein YhfC